MLKECCGRKEAGVGSFPGPVDTTATSYAILQKLAHPAVSHLCDVGCGVLSVLLINMLVDGVAGGNNLPLKIAGSAVVLAGTSGFTLWGASTAQQYKDDLYTYFYGESVEPSDFFNQQLDNAILMSTMKKNPSLSRTQGLDGSKPVLNFEARYEIDDQEIEMDS